MKLCRDTLTKVLGIFDRNVADEIKTHLTDIENKLNILSTKNYNERIFDNRELFSNYTILKAVGLNLKTLGIKKSCADNSSFLDKENWINWKGQTCLAVQLLMFTDYAFDLDTCEFVKLSDYVLSNTAGQTDFRISMTVSNFVLESKLAIELDKLGIVELTTDSIVYADPINSAMSLHYKQIVPTEERQREIEEYLYNKHQRSK